ncbi:hypothetical protein YPPY103_1161, partial [Yersinia pestis PY-103]
MVTPAIL